MSFSPALLSIYLLMVPITIAFIVAGISIFIVPKIKNIYADFGVDLPSLSFMFIKLTNWISEYWYLFLALPLLFLYAAAFIFFRESFRKSFGAALWPFPASRRKRSTLVLRAIDLAVRDSLPIEPALRALAAKHPYPARRRRLQKLCDAVERSSDVWEALAKRRLISLREVELFRAAENVGNLSWALHYSIERRDAKADRLVMIAAQLIGPIIVLCLGALVAFVCVGAFLPLVELISAMS